jgi:O-antigen ligase
MSHWMTFSGQLMIVWLLTVALLLLSPWPRGRRLWLWLGMASAILTLTALVLGMTRGVWLGCAAGLLYLVWRWKPRLLLAVPVLLVAGFLLAPPSVRTRLESFVRPKGQLDSNQHRIVCWRTGFEMIKARPLLGLGPEIVHRDFVQYVPADIPRPLPEGYYGHLHSIYIHYAAERGIPALLFLLWMFGKILADFGRAPRDRFFLHGAVAVVIAVMIEGAFELNLGDSEVLAMFLTVVVCGYLTLEERAT